MIQRIRAFPSVVVLILRRALAPSLTLSLALLLALSLSLSLASCGSADHGTTNTGNSSATSTGNTISVTNCGATVTIDGPPQRVTLLRSAAVPTLSRLGVLTQVTHRAGKYPEEYYDDATNNILASIPSLTEKTDTSGHLQISREEVVATAPDLILGETSTVNRQTLAGSGPPLIEEPAFCGSLKDPVTWDDVWDHVQLYGTIFHREADAESYISELRDRLTSVTESPTPVTPEGTPYRIAVLYPTVGGGVTYAYGLGSMAAPVVSAAGAENVYGDQLDRVFEVSAEDIVDRNPDIIIALHSDGSDQQMIDAIHRLPGIGRTTAGREGHILPMLLNYAEPPTPLAVDGLELLDTYLRTLSSAAGSSGPLRGNPQISRQNPPSSQQNPPTSSEKVM